MGTKEIAAATIALLGPIVSLQAICEIYLSESQACDLIFPHATFKQVSIELKSDDIKQIESQSGQKVRNSKLKAYQVIKSAGPSAQTPEAKSDVVYIDQVLGKHEFITYAVGVSSEGKVKAIEILEYRESYGSQVKTPEWRAQFQEKDKAAPLKVGSDIKNISGATLSSAHVTQGVKRILITHDLVKSRI